MYNDILKSVTENKVIVIVRNVQKEKLVPLAQAMYDGGIRLLEVTYDATGKTSDKETAENIRLLAEHFEGRMYIGAGTVLTTEQVELTHKAGGCFIISPNVDGSVIKRTKQLGLVSMPGALTPTEIQLAHTFGADFVKVFPAGNFGAGYIKAVKAPLSHIKLLAVGGVNENNVSDFLKAGAYGVGVGGNIVNKKMLENNDYEGITNLAKRYVSAIKEGV